MCDIHINDIDGLFQSEKSFAIKSLIELLDDSEFDETYKLYESDESTVVLEIHIGIFDLCDGLMHLAHDIVLFSDSINISRPNESDNMVIQIEFLKDDCYE